VTPSATAEMMFTSLLLHQLYAAAVVVFVVLANGYFVSKSRIQVVSYKENNFPLSQ
jgi:hypothetical protein